MSRYVVLTLLVLLCLAPVSQLYADDLEIFGGTAGAAPPNVLIVFDNSGSMSSNDVPDGRTRLEAARDVLLALVDSTDTTKVNMGLMSFIQGSGGEGGRIHQPCGASKAQLKQSINYIYDTYEGGTGTPLGEALEEAGLYFAGLASKFAARESEYNATEVSTAEDGTTLTWYQNNSYNSPIVYTCQNNIIIFMTDGDSSRDGERITPYINGHSIISDGDSELIDDVAQFFTDHEMSISGLAETQNIQTYTIGFDTASTAALLTETANKGNGKYYTASDPSGLADAFDSVLNDVQVTANAIYAPPVIPRNPENQIQSGDKVFMAFFKPQSDGRWLGNLKAYSLINGELRDADNVAAVYPQDPAAAGYVAGKEGYIKDTARSYWSAAADGLDVAKGGAGKLLDDNNSRDVYTFTFVDAVDYLVNDVNPKTDLTDPNNDFRETTNPKLTAALLDAASAAERATILSNTLAGTTFKDENGATQSWTLGDIVHSEPFVEAYKQNDNTYKNYIFVGANDGMLHVFDAADGQEKWAFIPPKQLPRLKLLLPANNPQKLHHYFVDGSPVVVEINNEKILFFGEGRGGERYYALNVTDPLTPVWLYQVDEQILETAAFTDVDFIDGAAVLGQSWAKPQLKKIRVKDADGIPILYDVFLLAGGYDARYEDPTFSVPSPNNIAGRAIYTIDATSGSLVGLNVNGGNWRDASDQSIMNHSILGVTGFDAFNQGYMTRVYAGDLGGNLFAARYDDARDTWEELLLLDLPEDLVTFTDTTNQSVTKKRGQKFMTRPDATLEKNGECVYFGTGDRENLTDTDRVDAFYAVCNKWEPLIDNNGDIVIDAEGDYEYKPVLLGDLVDVTGNLLQDSADATERATIAAALANGPGWFLRMEHPGEKITSSPKVIGGKIFFTTFTPGAEGINNSDPCVTSFDLGVSRLYAIDYRTGAAVMELDDTGGLSKDDRSTVIGTSVAYEPVLATSGAKTTLYYGSGGKLLSLDVDLETQTKKYYWRQVK